MTRVITTTIRLSDFIIENRYSDTLTEEQVAERNAKDIAWHLKTQFTNRYVKAIPPYEVVSKTNETIDDETLRAIDEARYSENKKSVEEINEYWAENSRKVETMIDVMKRKHGVEYDEATIALLHKTHIGTLPDYLKE